MGGTGGGRVGAGGILLVLPRDDVEPPRVLCMGKSAPPGGGGKSVSEIGDTLRFVCYSRPTSPKDCSISLIACGVRICDSRTSKSLV